MIRQTVIVEGGAVEVTHRGGLRFRQNEGQHIWLTIYDLAELLRIATGKDTLAIRAIAQVMENGHRFTDDEVDDTPEEPW